MINITGLSASGKNKNGKHIVDYVFEAEKIISYYKGVAKEVSSSYWGGKLASSMGLEGVDVDPKHMLSLCDGFDPFTGEKLCQNAGEKPKLVPKFDKKGAPVLDDNGKQIIVEDGGHRVGFDLTFSAPQSFSTLYALSDNEMRTKLLDVQKHAVQVAFQSMEDEVETRRGSKGKDVIKVEGLIASFHQHFASRELDPQVHTHGILYGVAKGDDGKWGTFDSHEIFQYRKSADEIYKTTLAMGVQALGFKIEQDQEINALNEKTGVRSWHVPGTEELNDLWSKRRKAIVEYQQEHGGSMQNASMATRKNKDEPPFAELDRMWQDAVKELKALKPELLTSTDEIKKREIKKEFEAPTDDQILNLLHEKDAVFSRKDITFRIGQAYTGMINHDELAQKVDEFIQNNELVQVCAERIHVDDMGQTLAKRHTETRFAAPWMVAMEQAILDQSRKRENEVEQHVGKDVLDHAIQDFERDKGFKLSAEQRDAVEHLTTKTGGVGVLSGLAGTGKTTVSLIYAEAFKAEGRTVLGACVSNAAAQKLNEETSLECTSVAKMIADLDKGKLKLTDKHVVVLDEAGMMDSKQTYQLMKHASEAKAKIILQGDTEQIQPVGAGSGMMIAKDGIGDAMLTEIRRQKKTADRETALTFYDIDENGKVKSAQKVQSRREVIEKSKKTLGRLESNDQIDVYGTQKQALSAVIKDYFASTLGAEDKLLIAHSNDDVKEINARVRQELKNQGMVGREDYSFKSIGKNKSFRELTLSRNDEVCFNVKDKNLDVINGTRGKVLDIRASRAGGCTLKVQTQDGGVIKFDTNEYNALDLAYCSTIHKAQGQGKKEIYHLGHAGMMDNQSALVAFTRLTSGSYKLYTDSTAIEQIKNKLGEQRLKENALEIKKTPAIELDFAHEGRKLGQKLSLAGQFKQRLTARRQRMATASLTR